jgi:hypothetical protein
MSELRLELKRASGWFAAGAEVLHAATLLSDGAFKLFVWMCLHAERKSGRLQVTVADLARTLRKSEGEIRDSMDELERAGVCRCNVNITEIQDRYWPYQRAAPHPVVNDSEAYVASVRRLFLSHACVSGTFSPADERLACQWRRRGISFERVERAINLGVARKYTALINHGTGTPITTLHYFERLIDEVDQADASPNYWRHVAARTVEFARRWQALRPRSHSRPTIGEETK